MSNQNQARNTATIEGIDAEIDILEARLHELRVRRNRLSTACLLPDDILAYIFQNLKKRPSLSEYSVEGKGTSRQWYIASLACQRWRAAVIDLKIMWAHVELWNRANLSWINLCIARAGTCALTLHVFLINENCGDDCDDECGVPCEFEHCNRHVTEHCAYHSYSPDLVSHLSAEGCIKRVKDIKVYNAQDYRLGFDNRSNYLLVHDLLDCPSLDLYRFYTNIADPVTLGKLVDNELYPQIEELRLQGMIPEYFSECIVPDLMFSLTTLELCILEMDGSSSVLRDLCSILSQSPYLERLLVKSGNEAASFRTANLSILPTPQPLSNLRVLALYGPPLFLTTILRMIIILPRETLHMETHFSEKPRAPYPEAIKFIHSKVIDFWTTTVSKGSPLNGQINDPIIFDNRDCYKLTFSGKEGLHSLFYSAEYWGTFNKDHDDLMKSDALLANVRTMVISINWRSTDYLTLSRHEWPNVIELVINSLQDYGAVSGQPADMDVLWKFIEDRRFRSVSTYTCKMAPTDIYQTVRGRLEEMQGQGVVRSLFWYDDWHSNQPFPIPV